MNPQPTHNKKTQPSIHEGQPWLERPVIEPAPQPTYPEQPKSFPQPEAGIPHVPHRWSEGSREQRALGPGTKRT